MPATLFDRDSMARWYAEEYFQTDPGLRTVYYLPTGSPEREIRLVAVNDQICELEDGGLEPIDFGFDRDMENEHMLWTLDVTPRQWDRIQKKLLALPAGWSLEDAVSIPPRHPLQDGINGK